jgi:hypothetical protein
MKSFLLLATLVVSASLAACGGAAPAPKEAKAPEKLSAAPPLASAPQGPVEVRRSQVKHFAERPGEFFQSVDLDERAVFADGKFHGFRLLALRDGLERSGLQPGDVVVSVNKMPIERPEQAIAVFHSLEKAKELRVDYERNGEPKTVTLPIIDDGSMNPSAPSAATQPVPAPVAPASAAATGATAPSAPASAPSGKK